jgi:hypothetical protein
MTIDNNPNPSNAADFDEWAKECGFTQTSKMPLTGPSSAVIAIK